MTPIYQQWLNAKAIEATAIKTRRDIEDALVAELDVPKNLDGTMKREVPGYAVTVEGRINRKVDSKKLQLLAAEHGLTEHLSSLFRWKPELALTAWKAASPNITTPLLDAITATPGRPSFTITEA
jgi:hypothetical protein